MSKDKQSAADGTGRPEANGNTSGVMDGFISRLLDNSCRFDSNVTAVLIDTCTPHRYRRLRSGGQDPMKPIVALQSTSRFALGPA